MKQRLSVLAVQFNWRMMAVRWLVYGLILLAVALLMPQIYFVDKRVWVWPLVAAAFGVLNAVVRPLLQALMLQLFFASMGLVVALINGFMLYLLSWVFPNRFAVDSILWALVGGVFIALLGSFLEGLFGLTRPIVPESEADLNLRLKAQDRSLVYTFLKARPVALVSEDALLEIPGAAPAAAIPEEAVAEAAAPVEAKEPVLTEPDRAVDEVAEKAAPGPGEPAIAAPAPEEEVGP